jgi:hypothetical protein
VTADTLLDAGASLLRPFGVAPRQYRLLVRLFHTLGERHELSGNIGMDRQALRLTTLTLVLPGGLLALFAFSSGPLARLDLTVLVVSSFVLFMLLTIEAANSFLNPSEIAALASKPIDGRTYFAAKFTYLIAIALRAELALNGPASVVALTRADTRWFYPLTHMAAACGLGIFIALVVCALCGLLFRFLPASRIRAASLWLQLAMTMVPLVANVAQRPARRWLAGMAPHAAGIDWSGLPLTWFHALAMAGHEHEPLLKIGWSLAAGAAASTALITLGIHSLSAGYMTRIVGVLRSSPARRRRRAHRLRWPGRVVAKLTGGPAGRAGCGFAWCMMRRDWQFRRAILPMTPLLLFIVVPIAISGHTRSPFTGVPTGVSLLPEILPFLTFGACLALSYSDHYRGAWIFNTIPAASLRAFVRGMYLAVWLPLFALPVTLATLYFAAHWGVVDAMLFGGYGIAVASLLFGLQLFLIETLPFTHAPRADRPVVMIPLMLFGPVAIGLAWYVQARLLFSSRPLTLAAVPLFAALAIVVGRNGLAQLEARGRRHVATLS